MITDLNWKVLDRITSIGCLLVTQLVLARALGPVEFGLLSFASACLAFLAPISKFGVGGVVTSYLRRFPLQYAKILESAMSWRAIGAALAVVLGLIGVVSLDSMNSLRDVAIVVVLLQLFSVLGVLEFHFEANANSRPLVQCRLVVTVAFTCAKVLMAVSDTTAGTILFLQAVETALTYAVSFFLYRKLNGVPGSHPSLRDSHWMRTLGRSVPWILGAGAAEAVYLKIDVALLAAYSGLAVTGMYALASRISEALYFLPLVIASSLYPYVTNRGVRVGSQRLQRFLMLFAAAGFIWALVVSAFALSLLPIMFGREYSEAVRILLIHVWATPFVFMRGIVSRWFIEEELSHYSFITTVLAALSNIMLNILLIPFFSATGAAFATVISYAAASFGFLFLFRKTRPLATISVIALVKCFQIREYRWFFSWCRKIIRRRSNSGNVHV